MSGQGGRLTHARAGVDVEFKRGDPDYGAMRELLLIEWLESVGYRVGADRGGR